MAETVFQELKRYIGFGDEDERRSALHWRGRAQVRAGRRGVP
jgi:hypothetical protein